MVVSRGYLPELFGGFEITASETIEHLIGLIVCGYVTATSKKRKIPFSGEKIKRIMFGACGSQYKKKPYRIHLDPWHHFDLKNLTDKFFYLTVAKMLVSDGNANAR